MAEQSDAPDDHGPRYEQARKIAEDALAAYARGYEAEGDRLAEEAKRLDCSAVVEVVEEIDEDAGSDPDAANRAEC
ncbi:MAG TPA: hypothetical protein VFL55_01385 [Acetobacteraceae bacterium]|nr:hypothetical protein [Acetobacteraceae bacterium]